MLLLTRTKKSIGCWLFCIFASIAVILPVYFFTDFGLSNICAIVGVIYLAYISLRAVGRWGIFDVFNYQLIRWTDSFRKGSPRRYEDAYEYKETMKGKREQNPLVWLPFVVIGTVLVGLSILFAFYPV